MVTCVILSAAPIHFSNPEAGPPCTFEGARSSAFVYGLLMFFEIVLMLIAVFVKFRYYFGFHDTLISVYGDGLVYMSCITSIDTIVMMIFVLTSL
ncbi:hypothetical protein BDR06DRAFT_955410 [Suillus hirtellus]|nr:hypothetical protein BDR06DRAFT_955410 [Suillus hirtellus]